MAKRHEALIPLTHDHHHLLGQARRLRKAASGTTPVLRRAADDFVSFYLGRARRHFHEEEELFFPPLVDENGVGRLITRAVTEHLRLHAMVRTLRRKLLRGEVGGDDLLTIAELLDTHIRFEEQELFPLIELSLSNMELIDLATNGRRDV